MTHPVLIAEDDPVQRRLLDGILRKFGFEPLLTDTGEAALSVLAGALGHKIGAFILDLGLPDMDGLAILEAMGERGISVPVIVQTAQGSIETVIAAMRAGAFDYVVKPVSPERLRKAIDGALLFRKADGAAARRISGRGEKLTFRDIITQSPSMEKVMRLARKGAATSIPVLIEGESGVGKELIARAIQGSGDRRAKPFVTVNCGAIPANLVESILFGHEKGAFTGASERHAGKFVEADGGTLFLDEIGDLPLDVQVKLLRAVQDGEIDPVGASKPRRVDIRLISATHRDLLQRVRDGRFREDLYYRLNVFPILVPPLRKRREDIPALVRHFMKKHAGTANGGKVKRIADDALTLLCAYDWPGNIRQLENSVLRAVVLCDGDMLGISEFPQIVAQVHGIDTGSGESGAASAADPPDSISLAGQAESRDGAIVASASAAPAASGAVSLLDRRGDVRPLADVECDMIRFAIEHYDGRMSEVARRLGIGRSTLYRKLKEYDIDPDRVRYEKMAS